MSANLSSVPKLQFFDNNGNPLVAGKLYTYEAGTTTPLATYTDSTATTPNTNPIILDSRGEANVWLTAAQYKFELRTAADALIWTVDNISNALNLSQLLAASGSAANPPYTFAADPTTGMYLAAAGQIGISANGVPVLRSTDSTMIIGQSGGSNDVDLTLYGDATLAGNMAFSGTGRRITGDFSNATIASRVLIQTTTSNDGTSVGAIPNGTTTNQTNFAIFSTNDPANASIGLFGINPTLVTIASLKTGTASNLPLIFDVGGSERVRIDTSGDVTLHKDLILSGATKEAVYALSGTTPALDPSNGGIQTWTLSGNSTPTDSLASGESVLLMIDDGLAYTITWPSVTWKTNSGVAPTLNTTGFTVVLLWKVSTTLYGARVGNA